MSKYRPFNLKEALDRKPVVIVNTSSGASEPFIFSHTTTGIFGNKTELIFSSMVNSGMFGSDLNGKSTCSDLQLAMAPVKVKKTVYVNIFSFITQLTSNFSEVYDTYEKAIENGKRGGYGVTYGAIAVPTIVEYEE